MRSTFLISVATLLGVTSLPAVAQPAPDANGPTWVTLGTSGGPVSNPQRSQPANALMTKSGIWLVDTGDAAVQQLSKTGVPLFGVKGVIISHLHLDHTGGLGAVVGLRYQLNIPGKLLVYGPPGTKALVAGIVASLQPFADAGYGFDDAGAPPPPADTVEVRELAPGEVVAIGDGKMKAEQNSHYSFVPGSAADQHSKSYAYRFDFPGKSIVYTGDTGPSQAVARLGRGADLLVAEMIDLESTIASVRKVRPDMDQAQFNDMRRHLSEHHLTPDQVGSMAAAMGVKRVAVTHLAIGAGAASQDPAYIAEIKTKFGGEVTIAHDMDRF
jgi:ribonuclease BN (tRNA processing enzyme)